MDKANVVNSAASTNNRDDKAYLRYLVESNLTIVKGCTTQLNSTKTIADDLGTKIAAQGDQIKGITKNVDLLGKHTKEGEQNLNTIESESKSFLYFCCRQCTRTDSLDEINLSPAVSKENLNLKNDLPITVQPKLRNQSIDYGNGSEVDQAIDSYLGECQDSLQFIKEQAIVQGSELMKQNKDLNKITVKAEYNTLKFKNLTTKTRKLMNKSSFFSFF